ncbi:TPA: hypothetical protein ACMDSL_004043, partial [Vibrio parahaemolyticus]
SLGSIVLQGAINRIHWVSLLCVESGKVDLGRVNGAHVAFRLWWRRWGGSAAHGKAHHQAKSECFHWVSFLDTKNRMNAAERRVQC